MTLRTKEKYSSTIYQERPVLIKGGVDLWSKVNSRSPFSVNLFGNVQIEAPEPSGPVGLASGDFISRSRYTVTGDATVYELEDGSRTLRLEDFESTNGPNLFVYLTSADADAPDADLDGDFIDLGALRGNVGNQNYDIPADVDLEVYDTVVIWCRPFAVAFGAADLS